MGRDLHHDRIQTVSAHVRGPDHVLARDVDVRLRALGVVIAAAWCVQVGHDRGHHHHVTGAVEAVADDLVGPGDLHPGCVAVADILLLGRHARHGVPVGHVSCVRAPVGHRIDELARQRGLAQLPHPDRAGHADMGYGYMVAEDNWAPLPGGARMWKLGQTSLTGQLVYSMTDWSADAGHMAHGNSVPGVAPEQQYVCNSNATRVQVARSNEIVCYRLDSSGDVMVVAPVMTDLDAPGGGDDYSKRPKANIDVTGQYMIWTTNMGGNRLDAIVVKVPSHLLSGTGLDVTCLLYTS